ncbi:hypothetical protein BVC80_1837g137 [Macleaya cordata]|uniref:Uncharacterized protein n=1 Tax=Macleaya cordata TaxID=56857 RepID=A0A200R3P3_MACCD|nr:hypothetical protein BVC80_1837g137 [Macleaya cordata]
MLRQNRSIEEGLVDGQCKIRKRGCSSSSSASSVLQNYRFKRAILVGKRGGSSTPVPTWKMMNSRSPYSTARMGIADQSPRYPPSQSGGGTKGKQAPVSARKLAATLWEMNEMPSPRIKENSLEETRINKKETRGGRGRDRDRDRDRERVAKSVRSGSLPPHLSDPSHSPVSDRMDRSGTGSLRKRTSTATSRRQLRLTDHHNDGGFDSMSNASLMEIEMRSRCRTPSGSIVGVKTRLKDLSNGLTTSKELLKILNRIWGLEEQHSSGVSLISALHTELERSRMLVDQMIREQRSDRHEIDYLMKHFAEEKASWKIKERERMRAAFDSVAGDLEVERRLRRRTESLSKKLGSELAETKEALLKAVKELESEKRKRQMMEQVCDELAVGIGEDKAEAEEVKRESAKVREEVEKEREMLQLADVLREERLQMKLSEAKYQFEEKNAAVDKLRNELEAFLVNKIAKENRTGSQNLGSKGEVEAYLSKSLLDTDHNDEESGDEGEVEDEEEHEEETVPEEDDSAESDLHSIELNMDNNCRSYGWSYTGGAARENPKRVLVEEEIKGRKSLSEKIQRGRISLERRISDGIDLNFGTENSSNWEDGHDHRRFPEHDKQNQGERYEDEMQRYKSVKGLRDHILSGSRMASTRGFASPTRQWGQLLASRHPGHAARGRATMGPESGLKTRLVEARGEGQNSRRSRQ